MATIAPWLSANNPLDFMRAGASLGLQLRAQDEAAERANAALALEQDKLNLSHQHFKATAAQAEARAAEALRAHNALELYRQQNMARQEAAQAARDALEREKFAFTQSQAKEKTNVTPAITTIPNPITGEPVAVAQGGGRWQIVSPTSGKLTQEQQLQKDLIKSQITQKSKAIEALKKESFGPKDTNNIAAVSALQDELNNLHSNLLAVVKQPMNKSTNAPSGSLSAPVSTQGGRVKVKSPDGKIGYIPSEEYEQALKEGYIIWNN